MFGELIEAVLDEVVPSERKRDRIKAKLRRDTSYRAGVEREYERTRGAQMDAGQRGIAMHRAGRRQEKTFADSLRKPSGYVTAMAKRRKEGGTVGAPYPMKMRMYRLWLQKKPRLPSPRKEEMRYWGEAKDGQTSELEKRCVADVIKKDDSGASQRDRVSRAYAICRSSLQKSGRIKKGKAELTKKGKGISGAKAKAQDHSTKMAFWKKSIVAARKK